MKCAMSGRAAEGRGLWGAHKRRVDRDLAIWPVVGERRRTAVVESSPCWATCVWPAEVDLTLSRVARAELICETMRRMKERSKD